LRSGIAHFWEIQHNFSVSAKKVIEELTPLASAAKAFELQRFFKTGPGQYGEGDVFIGVVVPDIRKVAHTHKNLSLIEIDKLLDSDIHESRLCAVIILTLQFKATKDAKQQKKIFDFYIKALKAGQINNWDLVDVSAPIIGTYLVDKSDPYPLLSKLAKSKSLWERRVAIIFTFAFIRAGELDPTIEISELLLKDEHDLIHKAVGWMLRELGKRDGVLLRKFLTNHSKQMPRTALRYAIEKMPESERKKWLLSSK
jgi:3-methyladenine DNA glycosylase AlkD